MIEEDKKDIEEKSKKFREEIEKYMAEEKPKKNYSLYLTEEDVEYIKQRIKTPLSKMVDDIIRTFAIALRNVDKENAEKEKKDLEQKNEEGEKQGDESKQD